MPGLPFHTAGPYVFAAYIVFFTLVVVYVAIMAVRLTRVQREVVALTELARQQQMDETPPTP
jgi:CcmD family protein